MMWAAYSQAMREGEKILCWPLRMDVFVTPEQWRMKCPPDYVYRSPDGVRI